MTREQALDSLTGKRLQRVEISTDKEHIRFYFSDGTSQGFYTYGDCCSHTWIEHLEDHSEPSAEITGWRNLDGEVWEEDEFSIIQPYHLIIETSKGSISIEYRNRSNGYYGGSLEPED